MRSALDGRVAAREWELISSPPPSPPCPQHSYSPFPSSASPLTTHFYCIWSFYLCIARTNSNFVLLLLLPVCERFLLLIFFSFSPQIQVQSEWEVISSELWNCVELSSVWNCVELSSVWNCLCPHSSKTQAGASIVFITIDH